MKTNQWLVRLTSTLLVIASGAALAVACSSGSNPAPATNESPDGTASSSGGSSGGTSGGSSSGASASSSGGSSGGSSSGGSSSDAGDGGVTDAAPCTNDGGDAALCHSCATLTSDPYNTCSSFVTNCVPFNNSVVPQHPSL